MTNPLNEDLLVWLDRIRLSTPWSLHARVSDLEAAIVRLELKIDSLEERMSEADSRWQQVANLIGLVGAEVASVRQSAANLAEQLAAVLANQEAGTAAAVDAALVEYLAKDAARADGLISSLSQLITTTPEIPAEVPEVPVPDPGEPAVNPDDPHPDQTLPGDLPS